MSMLSSSDYAYFYDDGRKMYHRYLGEVELSSDYWEDEAIDMLRDSNICPFGMLEPYAGIFVTDDGDVVDAQYRMAAISLDV